MNNQDVLKRLFTVLEDYYTAENSRKFVDYKSPGELQELLNLESPEGEQDWDRIFDWIQQYLDYGVQTSHPAFINRMWAGANLPSMLGEMVIAMSNTSACTYESAPVSTLFENYMISRMLELVGFDGGEGQMTTGSSNANMVAMMCARNLAGEKVKQDGLFGQRKLFAFVNAEAHYSMDKAANILGIGTEQLIKVPVDSFGSMDPHALQEAIKQVVQSGGVPFFVAATAGTTVRGAYDPILPIVEMRKAYGFWLHVDGAWGGAAVMSDTLRSKYLSGLEVADSFTCDFHKMLGSSLMCNILLVNNGHHAFNTVLAGGDGSYLFRDTDDSDVRDLGGLSLQCGRRVDGLKWFLDWKYYGKEGLGERIENYYALCEYAESRVEEIPELEMVSRRVSFNICFRYKADSDRVNDLNQEIRTILYQRGISLVGLAYVHDQLVMRLLITNTNVGREEIDNFLFQVVRVGNELVGE